MELDSKPHCKSCTLSIFLYVCEFVELQCDRQHLVEFFVLHLHPISFTKEQGDTVWRGGDGAFPGQTLRVVWGDYARQKRETGS